MGKSNVLMVDDSPQNLLALEAILKDSSYHLVSAPSGEEALKFVLQQDFAVILLDVQMPGLNGFETAKLIKARRKSRNIPIIFITAINKATEHVLEGYSVGAIDYIFKPFNPDTLKLKVEAFVKLYKSQKQLESQKDLLEQKSQELKEAYSKLQQTTLKLQKAEELSRVVADTSIDTIVVVDNDGKIIKINPAARQMFGYPEIDLIGQPVSLLFMDKVWERAYKNLPEAPELTTTKIFETLAVRLGNQQFPVEVQLGFAVVENQHIFVFLIRDISERKLIEAERIKQYEILEHLVEERTRELCSMEERFRKIFEFSPNLIAIGSLKDLKVMEVNPAWESCTGFSLAELKKQTLDSLILFDEKSNRLVKPVQNAKIGFLTHRGEMREGLLSTEKIRIQDEDCILSVITDVTESMRLEKEIAKLDRLFLVGEMAAGLAHEIRNPMTTVHGFLQVLNGQILAPEYANLMLGELKRANSIISELLNLARDKRSDKKTLDINEIIRAMVPLLQAEAFRQSKNLVAELTPGPPLSLDDKEIRQVILNLALNGLDAMEPGGQLMIKTYGSRQEVIMEVRDQGCGIKEEHREKIGTPFFTTKEKGTGLGLAICYSVALRHNATVNYKTGPEGTSFYVQFPVPVTVRTDLREGN